MPPTAREIWAFFRVNECCAKICVGCCSIVTQERFVVAKVGVSVKRILAILIIAVAVTFAGCGNGEDKPTGMPIETQPDYTEANEVNVAIAMESIAGVWNWPNQAGNAIFINADGTWYHEPGDHSVRGTVELTQDGRKIILEFVATEGHGPGIEGSRNPETNVHAWIPHPNPSAGSFSGTYLIDYDRLVILSRWDDSEVEMERNR